MVNNSLRRGSWSVVASGYTNTLFVILLSSLSSGSMAPSCVYEQYSLESLAVGRLTCSCRGGQEDRDNNYTGNNIRGNYTGNLNFLKQHLAKVQNNNPNIEVILTECNTIGLHLNFNALNNYNIILNIHNSNNTQIFGVTLREGRVLNQQTVQKISLRNIPGNITMTGHIKRTGVEQPELVVKVEQCGDLQLEHLVVDVPLKVTAKHLSSAVIANCSLFWLPWPGLYLFNVSRVSVTMTSVRPMTPRSVMFLADVSHINITHNVFPNVSLAVNVEEFSSMTIRCNLIGFYQAPEPGCPPGPIPLSYHTPGPSSLSLMEQQGFTQHREQREHNNQHKEKNQSSTSDNSASTSFTRSSESSSTSSSSTLTASFIYGLVWICVAVALLILVILIVICCCCQARRTNNNKEQVKEDNKGKEAKEDNKRGQMENKVEKGLNSIKEDETEAGSCEGVSTSSPVCLPCSSSSSMIPPPSSSSSIIPPPFILVNEVTASPGMGGVVLGCLTLGPSFPPKNTLERNKVNNKLKQQTFQKLHKNTNKL